MTPEEIDLLIAADESETLERKQSLDKEGVCRAVIAFANDLYGHGRGFLIVGQGPNKDLVGITVGDDEAQRTITDFARNNCYPAIPVSIECHERNGRRFAVVEVRASPARPHFMGRALVRMGSTTRAATDAEIILLRAVEEDRKVAILKRWLDDGQTTVVFWQMPAEGRDFAMSPRVEQARLIEVTENWIVLVLAGSKRAFPFSEFNIGYDPQQNLPQIRYHGGHTT